MEKSEVISFVPSTGRNGMLIKNYFEISLIFFSSKDVNLIVPPHQHLQKRLSFIYLLMICLMSLLNTGFTLHMTNILKMQVWEIHLKTFI